MRRLLLIAIVLAPAVALAAPSGKDRATLTTPPALNPSSATTPNRPRVTRSTQIPLPTTAVSNTYPSELRN